MRRRRLLVFVATAAAVVAALVLATRDGGLASPPRPGPVAAARPGDPFAYVPAQAADFVARASAGNAHVLFVKSPGGVLATAARVAAWRALIDQATAGTAISPDLLEALVFVESAGRPQVIAGSDPANAAGLTQILSATGQSLLGMHIDLGASRRLTARIDAITGDPAAARRLAALERRRAAVDDRFVPARELSATVRYLQIAERDVGRENLAFESYHMGIGNLTHVLDLYDRGRPVPYAQLYFDSTPRRHAQPYELLAGFGDDSSLYLWRLLEAERLMRLYRSDRTALTRLAALQTADDSGAAALASGVGGFADPAALAAAYQRRELVPLPSNAAKLGLAVAPGMGAGARALGATRALYRGLRPTARTVLIDMAAWVRRLSGSRAALQVASTVADVRYQRRFATSYPAAATGYSFAIARAYAGRAQAGAFQAVLDRLQSLDLIAWAREPATIDVTVAPEAAAWLARR